MSIETSCTWGEGPDIIVSSKDHKILLLEDPDKAHFTTGIVERWQLDLTSREALELAIKLIEVALQTIELEESYKQSFVKNESPV